MTPSREAALDRLLEHRAWVRGLVRSLVLDPSSADDVEQQVWLTALVHGGERVERPQAWLATVARNWARTLHRGSTRRVRREAAVARPEALADDADPVERAEAHRAVVDAVLALPEPLRLAVLRHYFDGLPVAEVAARLGVPHETVRSRLRLARERLRGRLGPAAEGAAWSPALLAVAGLPRDFAGTAASGTAALTGGSLVMTAAQKLAFALVLPAAVGAAWITAKSAAPASDSVGQDDALASLAARIDRLEQSVDKARPARAGDDRALLRRLDALEFALATQTGGAPGADEARPPGLAPAAAAPRPAGETSAKSASGSHEEIAAGLAAAPGSAEHLAALRRVAEWLVKSAGPPPVADEVAWAEGLLDAEGRRERITSAEAEELVRLLDGVAPGSAARPGLAVAAAGGWAKDDRLRGLLDRFPANAEGGVHRRLLALLDHHPGPAFSDYVTRLLREERDLKVLSSAVDADRVAAAATAENAAALAEAAERRLLDGSLDTKMRARVACAVAVAGLRAPEACAEVLVRIAGRETDAKLAETVRKAAAALTEGRATARSMEDLFD